MKNVVISIITILLISLISLGTVNHLNRPNTSIKTLSGIVIDSKTKETLVGVSISTRFGEVRTDLDGKFELTVTDDSVNISVNYISYPIKQIEMEMEKDTTVVIEL